MVINTRVYGFREILIVYIAGVVRRRRSARNVGGREERQIFERDRIDLGEGNHGSTHVGEVAGVRQFVGRGGREQAGILALNHSQVLEIREEEGLIADDSAANGAPELIL